MSIPIAYSVLGVILPYEKCFKYEQVKAFEHDHPAAWNVDPITGSRLWDTEKRFLFDIQEAGENNPYLVAYLDVSEEKLSRVIAIGYITRTTPLNAAGFLQLSFRKIEDVIGELEHMLKPHNLWNKEGFGLYTFQKTLKLK